MSLLLDLPCVASRLQLRPKEVKAMVDAGQIPHIKLPDGTLRYREADLEAWLDHLSDPAGRAPEQEPTA